MASDLEKKAKEAFIDDHFELAVELYTQAISLNPKISALFADRAQANIKLHNFTEAVSDANRAIELDPGMSKAYLRKATACMKLEEYQTAKVALEAGVSLAPGNSRFTNLIKECEERIAEEQYSEKVLTTVVPTRDVQPVENLQDQASTISSAKPKYRHEFFQKPDVVVLTILAKGLSVNSVSVDYGEQILSVSITLPGEEAYQFQPRLFGKIIPDKCKYDILSTKIEIRLQKAEPIHWTSLQFSKENTPVQRINVSSGTALPRPAYPSSKPKKVDWDKLEAQVKKEEKEEKLDGDAALNKFFQDIYKDADEDTKKAMKKSFVESSGTVLSTNWKEVGSKKVEGSPPDGMQLKKWET